ncbi:dual-specificity RNA methyltransferase RlmN [Ditylenchus destructor]|uniref:Dual-specificity RNA methyltransferase RlmN n=1 Tax=Ditylenchus destructor TaxID=166010 RepID=A0AAD4MF23_9BILA|nr:dual-specificity RNA methyltransferase RlmN [Ditylenchus destructor]
MGRITRWCSSPTPTGGRCACRAKSAARSTAASVTPARCGSGVVPMMARAGEEIGVNLAVSLHAVTKEVRDEIVPLNRKYGIEELLQACADYPGANNARRITFEYVMLKDKNDSDDDARELVRLIKQYKLPAKVNLIPFNPWPGAPYECSTPERIRAFQEIVFGAGISAPRPNPAWPRHRRRVRSAQDRSGEEVARGARPAGRREAGRARLSAGSGSNGSRRSIRRCSRSAISASIRRAAPSVRQRACGSPVGADDRGCAHRRSRRGLSRLPVRWRFGGDASHRDRPRLPGAGPGAPLARRSAGLGLGDGLSALWLETLADNPAAGRFFGRYGFTLTVRGDVLHWRMPLPG